MVKKLSIISLTFFFGCCFAWGQNMLQSTSDSNFTKGSLKNDSIKIDSHREIANIGISAGVSSLNFDSYPNWGYRVDIDVRYKISQSFGISFLLLRSVNQYHAEDEVPSPRPGNPYFKKTIYVIEEWKYTGFLAGPLFSIPLGEKVYLNLSPTAGYTVIVRPYYYHNFSPFSLNLETSIIINSGGRMAFGISCDSFFSDRSDIISGSIEAGIIYRFFK